MTKQPRSWSARNTRRFSAMLGMMRSSLRARFTPLQGRSVRRVSVEPGGVLELTPPRRLAFARRRPSPPGREKRMRLRRLLMIVPRDAHDPGDVLILDCGFEHHAFGELLDHRALDFLPRRLARRIFVAALLLQRGAALRQPCFRDQDISLALVEIDPHAVARFEQREPAADRRLR